MILQILLRKGGDIRFSLGFNSGQNEGNIFAGSDIVGASGKGSLFTREFFNTNGAKVGKADIASRISFNTEDILQLDFSNPNTDFVRELDFNKIPFSLPLSSRRPIGGDVTIGIRQSSNVNSLPRTSLNVKFELSPALQRFTFGTTPTFSIEGRL